MCGIAGIVSDNIQGLRPNLDAMRRAIAHRGPDGHGETIIGNCGLVHTRLSIVDLEGGKQPMCSDDERYTITFNGEIYGYKKLRDQLKYNFQTHSDTEVILALYKAYGKDMLDKLTGMYAFAIWDKVDGTLFCARDRFGEKPFYYAKGTDGSFIFASEVKSVVASGLTRQEIDPDSISHYLQKLYVHPSRSIYKDIVPLRPGNYLIYRDGTVTTGSYWDFPVAQSQISFSDAREKLVALLNRAIDDQLIADVPLGAFLSGGLDSSTVVAVSAGKVPQLTTLSYRIRGELDEGEYAKAVAERYGTRHIEMHEESHNLPDLMLRMAKVYDEPFGDSSNIPTYLICEQARRHCKVVLTGDGADELFGGYVTKYRSLIHMINNRNRSSLVNAADYLLTRVANKLRPTAAGWQRTFGLQLAVGNHSIASGLDRAYSFFEDDELRRHGLQKSTASDAPINFDGTLNDALKIDLRNYMAGDILVKTDRASMANGIELRAPFLDRELTEFVISLPTSMKIDLQRDKKLLRDAFESQWPPKVQSRGKQGFGAPVEKWLAEPAIVRMTEEYLADGSRISSLIDPQLIRNHRAARSYKTWALLMLSIWLENR